MNIIYDHILVRYGELSTKGKNKKDFIKRLQHNVRNALKTFDKLYCSMYSASVLFLLPLRFPVKSKR